MHDKPLKNKDRLFSVAPMMDWTDRHCRVFHRSLTRHALLYTEMVTAEAIHYGDRDRLLGFDAREQPVAVQLGGSDPERLAEAARIAEGFGYCEINLNVGCPSDRVQSGRFGACLIAEPQLVADCVAAMGRAVAVPVTVKCRIGIDDQDGEEALDTLADAVSAAGARTIIVHARKAWLKGLSPKENRDVPPLDYARVHRLKARRPDLRIIINGGIASLDEAESHLAHVDGVMLGRAAYQTPGILADVDVRFFDSTSPPVSQHEAVTAMIPYIERQLAGGHKLSSVTRHMLGLFAGLPGARAWRRVLSDEGPREGSGIPVLLRALDAVLPLSAAAQ